MPNLVADGERVQARVERLAREHFPHDDAERIHVALLSIGHIAHHLGRTPVQLHRRNGATATT